MYEVPHQTHTFKQQMLCINATNESKKTKIAGDKLNEFQFKSMGNFENSNICIHIN